MSTTTVPAPTFGFLYPSMTLTGVSSSSSCWEVLNAFLASADGAFVSRLRELPTGLLFITCIPGQAHSGAIYFYSALRRAFFMLDWAGRDDDFEAEEFDVLVDAFSLELALAPGACAATRRHARDSRHYRRHWTRAGSGNRSTSPLALRARANSNRSNS